MKLLVSVSFDLRKSQQHSIYNHPQKLNNKCTGVIFTFNAIKRTFY